MCDSWIRTLCCYLVTFKNAIYVAYTSIADLSWFCPRFPRQKFMNVPMESAVARMDLACHALTAQMTSACRSVKSHPCSGLAEEAWTICPTHELQYIWLPTIQTCPPVICAVYVYGTFFRNLGRIGEALVLSWLLEIWKSRTSVWSLLFLPILNFLVGKSKSSGEPL